MRRVPRVATVVRALLAVLPACQESPTGPFALDATLTQAAQYAGEVVTIESPAFRRLVLEPLVDSAIVPNRWTNFAVTVGGDTADSWRATRSAIAFRVPPLYTGVYEVRITATGYEVERTQLSVSGQAYPLYGTLHPFTNVMSGTAWPGRGLLISETWEATGYQPGYGYIDVQRQQVVMLPELAALPPLRPKMYVPGPSYRPDHFIFDLSPHGEWNARIWRTTPRFEPVDSLPCAPEGLYTAAELAPGVCLVSRWYSIIRNRVDTIVPPHPAYLEAEFRMAPGRWAAPRTRLDYVDWGPMRWPVLRATGELSFAIDTLNLVTGVAFSPAGDTIFATVAVSDPSGEAMFRWSLVALDAATGAQYAAWQSPPETLLQDVLVDPERPLLYVASVRRDETTPSNRRQHLAIHDRRTLELLASVAAASPFPGDHATLVLGGGNNRVHVMAWCGFDCGGVYDYAFDVGLPAGAVSQARPAPRSEADR